MPSQQSAEEDNIRSKVKREQAEESEATPMGAFMFSPLKQNGGSATEVTVSDEPFSPNNGPVQPSQQQQQQQINNYGIVPLSMAQLASSLGAGPASLVLPTSVTTEHRNQAEAPSAAVLSKALDDQVEALKKKICEKIQLRMQMNQQQGLQQGQQQQQQETGYQMPPSTLMPGAIMQSARGLYCCPTPLGAVVALPQGSQEAPQYSAIMAATGGHYPVQSAPFPIATAPPTADFSSFTPSSNAASNALFI